MKCADQVLTAWQIDAGFAANRAVNLGEQCRGHLNVRQSSEIAGSSKSCNIADHAAPKSNQQSLSIGAQAGKSSVDPLNRGKRLVSFPFGNSNRFHFESSAAQRTQQLFAMQGENCLA